MTRRTIEIAAFCVALLLSVMSIHVWLASRDEQQRLATAFASQQKLLDDADARERTRQSALDGTLAQIENLKRATQTPAQILASLPKYLPLPQPIALASSAANSTTAPVPQGSDVSAKASAPGQTPTSKSGASTNLPAAPAAQIPSADLKPLFDYVQDCRSCQAQLAAAKQDRADDTAKLAALTSERDAAVTAARGGTFWRRLRRNAIWFGVGTAFGAAAGYRASRH